MTTQYTRLDVESVAIQLTNVIATLQMALEGLPNDGRVGEIPEVLSLCLSCLSDQQTQLERMAEPGRLAGGAS